MPKSLKSRTLLIQVVMKTKIILSLFLLAMNFSGFSTKWTILNADFTFFPSELIISEGDSVEFILASAHNALEVSEQTWNADGNSALSGGFSTPFGGGLILPQKLSAGTHFFVCRPHASMGMKGKITVHSTTGMADNHTALNFSVYPNPTSGLFSVKANNSMLGSEYRIIDLSGNMVSKGLINNNVTQINLDQFSPGEYLFEILHQRRQSIKVIKN